MKMAATSTWLCLVWFVAAVTSAVSTSSPEPCTTPKQWEGSAWFLSEDTGIMKSVKMSYDEPNTRVRSLVTFLNGPRVEKQVETILRFDLHRFFVIFKDIELCVETNEFFEFKAAGVPADAKFQYENTRGLGKNSVTTNTWAKAYKVGSDKYLEHLCPQHHHHHHHHYGHTHSWFASFTDDLCVPVSESIYEGDQVANNTNKRPKTLYVINYSGMSAGIASEKVFDPPSYCSSSMNATVAGTDDYCPLQWHGFMYV